jgi:polysaccharide deacetylase family protein (PEP-CTERM system associated)
LTSKQIDYKNIFLFTLKAIPARIITSLQKMNSKKDNTEILNILSFDIEEYFHCPAYDHLAPEAWGDLEPRMAANLKKVMSMLGSNKATFFILGWIAERYPKLVEEIHSLGHEVACHGYMHKSIWNLSPEKFSHDLLRAKKIIEKIIGTQIIGFRAPNFSITENTLWAINIVQSMGFKYDSSIFPVVHDRYGIQKSPRLPYRLRNELWEIPLSTIRIGKQNLPFGGGGYFRLYPYWLTKYFISRTNQRNHPFVFYLHPWELEHKKIVRPKSVLLWLRRNLIIGKTENKLKKLLSEYRFVSIRDWLELHT